MIDFLFHSIFPFAHDWIGMKQKSCVLLRTFELSSCFWDRVTAERTVWSDPPSCWRLRRYPLQVSTDIHTHLPARLQGRSPSLNDKYLLDSVLLAQRDQTRGKFATTPQIQGPDQDDGQASWILEDNRSGTTRYKARGQGRREARLQTSCRAGPTSTSYKSINVSCQRVLLYLPSSINQINQIK